MKKNVLMLCLFAAFFACKKKERAVTPESPVPASPAARVIDTVKPRSYYPVYPGSYWKYLQKNGTTVTDSTSATYKLYVYATNRDGSQSNRPITAYDSSYVPLFNGQPVYGYQRLGEMGAYDQQPFFRYNFITETPGACSLYGNYSYCDFRYGALPNAFCPQEIIYNIAKTVNSHQDSILIALARKENVYAGSQPFDSVIVYREYTKNIGLTLYCRINAISHDTLEKRQLIEYHIGAH